jgi:hypothetical protein
MKSSRLRPSGWIGPWLAMAAAGAILSNAAARAARPANGMPALEVDYRFDDEKVLFDTSLSELTALARAAQREAHLPLLAIYTSTVEYKADIAVDAQEVAPELFCARLGPLRVAVHIHQRNIHVAREIGERGCLVAAATQHARAHAHNERRAYARVETRLRENLPSLAPASGIPPARTAIEAKALLTRRSAPASTTP